MHGFGQPKRSLSLSATTSPSRGVLGDVSTPSVINAAYSQYQSSQLPIFSHSVHGSSSILAPMAQLQTSSNDLYTQRHTGLPPTAPIRETFNRRPQEYQVDKMSSPLIRLNTRQETQTSQSNDNFGATGAGSNVLGASLDMYGRQMIAASHAGPQVTEHTVGSQMEFVSNFGRRISPQLQSRKQVAPHANYQS